MGLFFKKSQNFGLFKLNYSKSGIGISFGVKGFRISKNSKGTYINAGAKGLYYRKKIDSKNQQVEEYIEETPIKETAIIYQSPELERFTKTSIYCLLYIIILGFGLMFFNHPLRGMLVAISGFIFMFVYCLKNPSLFKEWIEQGKRINELQSQNYNVVIQPQSKNPESDEAIKKRNESKYKQYRYSYESYKEE